MEMPKSLKNKIIVDPYKELDKSNTKLLQKMKFLLESEKDENWMMYGDGSFHSGGNRHLFIYLLPASVAAYYIEIDKNENNFIKQSLSAEQKEADEQRCALAYFDKGLFKNGVCQPQDSGYLCLGYGKRLISEREHLDGWIEVPRLFFSGINDYVYLAVSCVNEPQIHVSSFPENQPFFWDLPVACSIYNDQPLSESKIIPGIVKMITKILDEENIYYRRRIYVEKTLKVEYSWQKTGRRLDYAKLEDGIICKKLSKIVKCTTQDGEYSTSVSLPIYVYNRNRNGITAFVWHSGNEDDLVKKSSVGYNEEEKDKFYNDYRYLLDSLSLGTIYGSFASLTKITEEATARYIVRTLAHQPEGYRAVSIEGHLVYLMGGALCWIGEALSHNKKTDSEDEHAIESIGENSIVDDSDNSPVDENNWDNVILPRIDAMFEINGSKLFFDNPLYYPNVNLKGQDLTAFAVTYLKNILGISKGMSGCSKLSRLLKTLFSKINKLGLSVDYVYCDIEKIYNDAWMLKVLRFDEHYIETKARQNLDRDVEQSTLNDEKRKVQANIYHSLWEEIQEGELHHEIYSQMMSLGFYNEGRGVQLGELFNDDATEDEKEKWNVLYDIYKVAEGKEYYGIANSKSYERRRNLNVWDVAMKNYMNELFLKYVVTPVKQIFKNAKCSCYGHTYANGYINHADNWETYLGGSLKLNGDMYSSVSLYGNYYSKGIKKLSMDNWEILPTVTPYSFFIDYINKARASFLSSPQHHFNVFIPSWNIWAYELNTELHFRMNNDIVIKSTDDMVQAYHKELLYHTFLLNPDKAIAYFSEEKKRNNREDYINIENYYETSYGDLNQFLEDLNTHLGGAVIPLTKTLAVETEPYVLSCAEVNSKWIWRLTVNGKIKLEPSKEEKGVISLNVDGRLITFSNVEEFTKGEGIGFWIVTPIGVEPKIEVSNQKVPYYQSHPAFSSKNAKQEMFNVIPASVKNVNYTVLRFNDYRAYTQFGELPRHHSMQMEFCIDYDSMNFDECELLDTGILKNTKAQFLKCIVWKSNGILYGRMESDGQSTNSIQLCLDSTYVVKLDIDITTQHHEMTFKGKAIYSLYKLGEENISLLKKESDFSYTNPTSSNFLISTLNLCKFYNKDSDSLPIIVKDFRLYFSGHQEKVELFRESNGLNISRVNKSIAAYRLNTWKITKPDVEVENENTIDENIIGKFSWLNACECKVKYKLTYSLFDEKGDEISLGDQERPSAAANIIYPLDGRLKLIKASYKNVIFEVEPQSEGYMLVKLLNCYSKSAKIKWSLYKLEDGDSGTENLLRETSIRIVDIIRNYSCDKKIASINLFKKNGETNYKTKQI